MLEEIEFMNAKPVDPLMDPNAKLLPSQGSLFQTQKYRRLVGKLGYRPAISSTAIVLSQFLNSL